MARQFSRSTGLSCTLTSLMRLRSLHLQENVAGALRAQLLYRGDAIAELRQRRHLTRSDIDQHREDGKIQLVLALLQVRQPLRADLAFAVSNDDDVGALELLLLDERHRGVDGRLEVGAAAGKI